jgi:hypothetical protein
MAVVVDLPTDIETTLRCEIPDLDRQALEALAIEWFRMERISHFQLRTILGLDRFDTDAFLKARGEYAQCLTIDDVRNDGRTIDRVMRELGR